MKKTTILRNLMDSGELVVAIGAHNAITAKIVERTGFNGVYIGSYATEGAFKGEPDLGLMTKTERLMIVRNISKAVNIPIIADMEEGYGNAVSMMHSVKEFEETGISGVHIDDEKLPCKCPFLPGIPYNQLISVEEMGGKIKAATEARDDPNFLIIARSDVVGTLPLECYFKEKMIEEVVKRSNAYVKAGADAIFVMAFTVDELEYYAKKIKAPLVGIFAYTEPIPIEEFEKVGCKIVIGANTCLWMSAKGVVNGLRVLKETRDFNATIDYMVTDEEYLDIVGLRKYSSYYKKYNIP